MPSADQPLSDQSGASVAAGAVADSVADSVAGPVVEPAAGAVVVPSAGTDEPRRGVGVWIASRWRLLALGLIAVLSFAIGAWAMTNLRPAWWPGEDLAPLDGRRAAELEATGADLESAVVSQLTMVRPQDEAITKRDGAYRSAVWGVSVSDEDMNAWLATRLPKWIESRGVSESWPKDLRSVRVRTRPSGITLGMRFENEMGERRFVTLECLPELSLDGSIWLRATWVHLGKLPIPASAAMAKFNVSREEYLPQDIADGPHVTSVLRVLSGEIPAMKQGLIRVDATRRVRLQGVVLREGRIELTCRTELK